MLVGADTVVHTLRGDRNAGHLADSGETIFCFTWATGRIIYGRCAFQRAGIVTLQRAVLDSGSSLLLSADSVLLRRDGEPAPLMTLIDKSVMPLYMSATTNGYPLYRQVRSDRRDAPAPCDRKNYRPVARMVWEARTGQRLQPGFLIRHLDGDRRNCHPENLRAEGRLQRKPRRNKVRKHIEIQKMRLPNNHKLIGFTPWGDEPAVQVVPLDCVAVAVNGIFVVVNHGS